jgi:bile acid:Na+ symporter, BASS family
MESSIITEFFLPLSLSIIMLGMGLTLTIGDFKRIIEIPKPIITGLLTQLIVLPAVAFLLVHFWTLKPEFAVGIILLAACPGGATSNLFAYLAKCDAALSISLTAISSLITIFTIPFIVNLGLKLHMGTSNEIALPVIETMLKIMIITVIPVVIGMYLKKVKPILAIKAERPVKIASGVIITVFIFGAIFKDRENVIPYFLQTGGPAFTLNMLTLFLGFWIGRLARLSFRQSATISIEGGIQNGTLAIAIASSTTLLNNSEIAIPAAIYSLIMFLTGGIIAYYFQKRNNTSSEE